MSATRYKQEPFSSNKVETRSSWSGSPLGKSAAATLIELSITLAGADAGAPVLGVCFRCRAPRNSRSSIAHYPNVFCSKGCEQEFVRAAVASLTLGQCIRIQHRLETLLMSVQEMPLESEKVRQMDTGRRTGIRGGSH